MGNTSAMYYLALLYKNGYYLPRNADSANALLTRAAKKQKQAQHELNATAPENPLDPILPPASRLNDNAGTYQLVKHNVNVKLLPGKYKGYAIRYDWSGQHILSVFPVAATFVADNNNITGRWVEGHDSASFQATCTDSAMVFDNTVYTKTDHYSNYKGHEQGEQWQFNRGYFNLSQKPDSVYLTGNLRLYSNWRKEFGNPVYVHLARVAPAAGNDPMVPALSALNPFHEQLPVTFTISVSSSVTFMVKTMLGQPLLVEQAGVLQPGTYQRTLQLPGTIPGGSYLLQLQTSSGISSIIIIKQ
jgi:hypothetical protein